MKPAARLSRRAFPAITAKRAVPQCAAAVSRPRRPPPPSRHTGHSHFSTSRYLFLAPSHRSASNEQAPMAAAVDVAKAAAGKTYYSLFPLTLPEGPPPQGSFNIDVRALRSEFLKRQQTTHPDLFPPGERKLAETASAQLNKAYSTLADPLLRAQYLLTLRGFPDPADDETSKLDDQELIMQVLEANEILEEATSEEDLEPLKLENSQRVQDSVNTLEALFDNDELEMARVEAMKLRYWKNVEESLRHWEPGKPVVLQH